MPSVYSVLWSLDCNQIIPESKTTIMWLLLGSLKTQVTYKTGDLTWIQGTAPTVHVTRYSAGI